VSAARADEPGIVLTVTVAGRRFIFPVPKRAKIIRMLNLALVESQQHLVADLGKPEDTAIIPSAGSGGTRPIAILPILTPRIPDLDAAKALVVLVVGDNSSGDSFHAAVFSFVLLLENIEDAHMVVSFTLKVVR
jgi:hypothetical protein